VGVMHVLFWFFRKQLRKKLQLDQPRFNLKSDLSDQMKPFFFRLWVSLMWTQKVSKFGALGQEFAGMRDGLPYQCPRLRICYIPYLAVRSDGKSQQQVEKVEYIPCIYLDTSFHQKKLAYIPGKGTS
jgi:hypothetical protein